MATSTKKKPWWPKTIADQLLFWLNFNLRLPEFTTQLALTVPELAQIVKDAAMFKYLYQYEEEFRVYMVQFLAYRKLILGGKSAADIGAPPVCPVLTVPASTVTAMLFRLFGFVKSIKQRAGYNTSIGGALKIIGADIEPFVPADFVSNGKGKGTVDGIVINFVKGMFIDGMAIFEQRGTDPVFHELIRVPKKGYIINSYNLIAGKPETRNYKTRAYIGLDLIGEFSPVFSVTWTSPLPPTPPPPVTP